MRRALQAYLGCAARGGDHHEAVRAAAEAVHHDPWAVVRAAGWLARARRVVAASDLGLTEALLPVPLSTRGAVPIEAGQPFPTFDGLGRRRRGAYDTPAAMARELVARTLEATSVPARTGLDPACGTGAFLVAMAEAGVPEIHGTDLDPTALAVARVACPRAQVRQGNALDLGPEVDLVVGNPPFVAPEHQDRALRTELRQRFPWLRGRFDLVIPFAATAEARVRRGGGLGLVLPFASLVQPYGTGLRRGWVQRNRLLMVEGPRRFPGVAVPVGLIAMQVGTGPAVVPPHGVPAERLLRLEAVPLSGLVAPGDVALAEAMRRDARPLGDFCKVDTGLVAHSAEGGKARLIRAQAGPGCVPYADAREFFAGRHRWIEYAPERMHRPKTPELFERPKLVIQRLRGKRAVRVAVDRSGVYVGHTCTVVQPHDSRIDLDQLAVLVASPLVDGLTRIERGQRLDLYPHDVAAIPIPRRWLESPAAPLSRAFGITQAQVDRLVSLAGTPSG